MGTLSPEFNNNYMDSFNRYGNTVGSGGGYSGSQGYGSNPALPDLPGLEVGLGTGGKDPKGFSFLEHITGAERDGMKTGSLGNLGLNLGSTLLNGYLGMKQYGLAKDSLAFEKDSFNKNYAAQKQLTNNQLRNQAQSKINMGRSDAIPVEEYMAKYGIQ